ncbi:MAG: nonstructural protein [Microviridae sp.]|nr:MAG: nonstructural protein [Microviridae sp.]
MMMQIFAVRDSAVEGFMQPFFSFSRAAAVRSLTEAVNDPKHEFFKHASYYALYHLGAFDDANGTIIPLQSGLPEPIISCSDLLNKA